MTTHLKLLVVDSYDAASRDVLTQAGASVASELFRACIALIDDTIEVTVIYSDDLGKITVDLDAFDGAIWTGSSLSVTDDTPLLRHQIALVRAMFDAGLPMYGSCYGAQLAAVSTGGQVSHNPRGREFGIARKIILNPRGITHPMFKNKPSAFDNFASHVDVITKLPAGAEILAYNKNSDVQAIHVTHNGGNFWAVQYHPEFNIYEVARIAVARQQRLIEEGLFADGDELARYVRDYEELARDPVPALCFLYGVDDDLLNTQTRTLEISNWIAHLTPQRALTRSG